MKDISEATKIYLGKDRHCRCGCAGTYAERGTKAFTLRVNKMKVLIAQGELAEDEGTYINLSFDLDNNKALTAYFD